LGNDSFDEFLDDLDENQKRQPPSDKVHVALLTSFETACPEQNASRPTGWSTRPSSSMP
jgi:hypothetical protein